MHTRLHSIKLELFRGDEKISEDIVIYNQPLFTLIKEETKQLKGLLEVRSEFNNLKNELNQTGYQIQDLLQTMDALKIKNELVAQETKRFDEEIKKFLAQEEF